MGRSLFIFLLTITHVSLMLNSVITVNPKKGFSIKMIHRDSKGSPSYPGDHLTRGERLQRLVEQSKARARYMESQILFQSYATRSTNPNVARMPVVYEPNMWYVAAIGLGNFPGRRQSFMSYFLMIDSGSDITWLQCDGATKNFTQDMPLYPWRSSTTFRPIPCDTHPRCEGNKCDSLGRCTYAAVYFDGSVASGFIAEEKFTLVSDNGGLEVVDLRFGCGLVQENSGLGNNHSDGKRDLIAGILGLGPGQWSFLNQLGDNGKGRFAYCFEAFNDKIEGSDTYLRFGEDATIGGGGQEVNKTPIVLPEFATMTAYYLNLEDISVGNRRIGFPNGTFELKTQGGGAVIDSGASMSSFYKDQFDLVADFVKAHFNALGIPSIGSYKNYDLCFRLQGRFDTSNFPSITLHFQRADYVITDYKANFVMIDTNIYCLGILRRNTNTPAFILGAIQQINKRILYDVIDLSLSFAHEYCELGS